MLTAREKAILDHYYRLLGQAIDSGDLSGLIGEGLIPASITKDMTFGKITASQITASLANLQSIIAGSITADSFSPGQILLASGSGQGFKFNLSPAVFGWADLIGPVNTRGVAGAPTMAVYRSPIYDYSFGTASGVKELFFDFHIPHDYVPNTDMYIHVHWSQITVDTGGTAGVPGDVHWVFHLTYASGYGTPGGSAPAFIAPISASVIQQGSTTQYGHMIAEVIFTGDALTASTFDRSSIEVDGLIMARLSRDASNPTDTLDQAPFVHFADIHYQTTGVMGTSQRNTPFYT